MLLGRPVAVKVLRGDYAHDPALVPAFREAAERAAAVSHHGVARVYDHGEGGPDGAPYLVTEFIEGPALAEVIRGEAVPASFIATVLAQVADGLHAAHQAGLLHGDLKPANILLPPEAGQRATITDFGITHALGAIPRAGHTQGTVHGTGTVLYLAPERVSGGLGTPASDLYSLGIIACEWLTGIPPFTGTSQQVLAAHLRRPLPGLPAAVHPGLAELVRRLADKDPASRVQAASEAAAVARALARELRACSRDDAGRFPVRPETASGLAVVRAQAVAPAPRAGDEAAGFRLSGLAAHKREIAWAASALVLAGFIGWAPSAPGHSAVKIVQLAPVAGDLAPAAGHPATGRQHPGRRDVSYSTAGDAGAWRPHGPGASWPGFPAGQAEGPRRASGHRGTPGGRPVADAGSLRPSPPAPGRSSSTPAGRGHGSRGPCPCGPTRPASSPASHPAPSTGSQPSSAPASQPSAWPTPLPLPPVPSLPVPTISVGVPPLLTPSAATPSSAPSALITPLGI